MAWKWFWNTETKYYDEEITRDTDWGGDESTGGLAVSGGRVQEWLKNEINGKYAVIRMSSVVDENNFYSLEMFHTEEDAVMYDSDPDTYADLVRKVVIPISTVQGDAFTATLKTSLSNTADIVVTEGKLEVPLNYRSIKITQIGSENANYAGSLVIQRSTDGSTWNTMGTIPNVLVSKEVDDTTSYQSVDIGKYLVQGKQLVRLRATYTYTNEQGEIKTVSSGNVVIGASVTKTELKLTLETNYFTPMLAKNEETGEYNRFVVNYRVMGATKKKLIVKVSGSVADTTITKELSASVDGSTEGISLGFDSNYGFHTHGVHEVVAYLEAEDGLGNTIKSEELRNQFMMVNPESEGYDANKKYLLLQNVKTEATNYIQTEVAQYAVYAPDKSYTEVTFKVTSSKDVSYTEVTKTAVANTANIIEMTVEIEPEDEGNIPEGYRTRFYVFKGEENFIASSGLNEFGYYDIYVDNRTAVVPVLGSTFLMNPKNRDNSETNPKRILNERANNNEVASTWENFGFINDGWMLDKDGNKVLRVMAGNKLTIKRNILKQFMTAPDSSMTIDIDYKVSNVTDLDNPIIAIDGGGGKGLILNALKGWVKTSSYNDSDNCMFAWREDKRQFLSLNIHNNVRPLGKECVYPNDKASQAQGSLALARVLLNGDLVREIPFDKTSISEWCTDENAAIIIGNDGADIDIYSIRVYENTQVDIKDLLNRNWVSSLPTTAEKQSARAYNDLLEGGRITLEKAQARGLNCIVYHGDRPYAFNTAEPSGWIEYFRYNQNGEFMPEYSGKNCEASKALKWKAQGSTGKTYYEHNVQDDNSKVEATIQVNINSFHSSFEISEPFEKEGKMYVSIAGGNLGSNFPLEDTPKDYPYENGFATVPDGWFDGNGKYRGMGYMVSPDTALAQKKVAKINWASAMHSHLVAACNSYDDLHFLVCGASPLQQQYLDKGLTRPVSAKRTEPFLMFWEMDGVVYYTGLCIYGAGKMDKVSWGYVKKKHPMFAMFEGADNNLPLTDFRVPFDDAVTYDTKEEGFVYNGSQSFDFDAGATNDDDTPKAEIVNQWKAYHNFIYLNSPNIEYYDGTIDQFRLSEQATKNLSTKYWCTEGSKAFQLIRYDYVNEKWVDAGLKGADGEYAVVDLRTDIRTKATYEKYKTSSAYATINNAFKGDFGKFFKANAKFLMSLDSLLFCYSYVLAFLAGTDNSSKNTYFKIDPIKQDMSAQANADFSTWWLANFGVDFNYSECYLMFMDGDDMDSILPVNNKGNLTKPYYIERLYPYADDKPNDCLYEGMQNQLFNLVELIYSDEERSAFMNRILTAAQSLVTTDDKLLGLQDNKVSVWGFLHKYFFNIQYYFPKIAYLEQARIRYEFAELMGHLGARSVRPISQSIGSQVENEQQFMEQRVVYMASFAVFGALGNKSGAIGLADTVDEFAFQGSEMPDGSPADFVFDVTPHQYIYPCGFDGQTSKPTYQRTSPKQTCKVTVAKGVVGNSDTSMGIRGVNYYSDLGNLTNMSILTAIIITGKRLIKIQATHNPSGLFKPNSIILNAPNITSLVIYKYGGNLICIDLSSLIRVKDITLGYDFNDARFPESSNLESVYLGVPCQDVTLQNVPNLRNFNYASDWQHSQIQNLYIGKNVATNTPNFMDIYNLVNRIYSIKNNYGIALKSVHIENIDWDNFDAEALAWLADRPTCELYGRIGIAEGTNEYQTAVTWDLKNKFIKKFGDVDSGNGNLTLDYRKRNFEASTAKIKGQFFVDDYIVRDKGYNDIETFDFSVTPESNYMNTQTKIQYSLEGGNTEAYSMSADGVLSVNPYKLSDKQTFATIKAAVTQYEGGAYITDNVTKKIDIWNRPAQVGDVVYYDGSYGSAEEYDDGGKTAVGVCFYVAPRNADGSINATYHNPKDKMKRLMVSREIVSYYERNTWQLGIHGISGVNVEEKYSLYTIDENNNPEGLKINNREIAEIPGLVYITKETRGPFYDRIFIDTTNSYPGNNGFIAYPYNETLGDGFSFREEESNITNRTITEELSKISGKEYQQGDIVNVGYMRNLLCIARRNEAISYSENGGKINDIHFPLHFPSNNQNYPIKPIVDCIDELREWAKSNEGLGDSANGNKWSQLYFPAWSCCYHFKPSNIRSTEVLSPKFEEHNWFLPTIGQTARYFIYLFQKQENGTVIERNDTPLKSAIDKGVLKRSWLNFHTSTILNIRYSFMVNTGSGESAYGSKNQELAVIPICAF